MVGARAAPPSSGTMMAPEGPPPLVICDWSLVIVVGVVALLAPGRAGAEAVVIFRDGEVLAVFPAPNLPAEARPHAERSGDLAGRLADQVRRDLERAWSAPSRPRR